MKMLMKLKTYSWRGLNVCSTVQNIPKIENKTNKLSKYKNLKEQLFIITTQFIFLSFLEPMCTEVQVSVLSQQLFDIPICS